MISHSKGDHCINPDAVQIPELICEGCGRQFFPVTDEPLCTDCVHELFETGPDDKVTGDGESTGSLTIVQEDNGKDVSALYGKDGY